MAVVWSCDHEGAFDVAGFTFDISSLSSWAAGGGGAVLGRPDLAPLVVDLKPGAHLNGFIEAITEADVIPLVRLAGVSTSAGGSETVYDLRLADVLVTKVTDTNGVDHLEFNYKQVTLTTTEQNANGSLGTSETIGWDVPRARSITTPLAAAQPGTDGGPITSDEAIVTINIAPINDAPILLSAIPDQTINEDDAWAYVVPSATFSDVDDASLVLTAAQESGENLPSWLSFDAATGKFSGLPATDFHGATGAKGNCYRCRRALGIN